MILDVSSDTRSGIEGVMEVCDVSLVKTSLDLELLLPSYQLLKYVTDS